jgi:hypothetical protein
VILLAQLAFLALILLWRRRTLLGRHLKPGTDKSLGSYLSYVSTGKYGRVTRRQLGIPRTRTFPLVVVPERWYHRLLKRVGLAAELELGDAALDRRWFIITDDPERLRRALASPPLRTQLKALLSLRLSAIRTAGDRAWIEVAEDDLKRADVHFRHHLELLGRVQEALLALRLEEAGAEGSVPSRRGFAYLALGLQGGLVAASVAGLALAWFTPAETIEWTPLVAGGLALGAVAAAAWIAFLVHTLRGTAWLTWLLTDLAVTGLAGFLLGGVLLVRAANIELDFADPQPAAARVMTRRCDLLCSTGTGKSAKKTWHRVSLADCSVGRRAASLEALRLRDAKCVNRAEWDFRVGLWHWRPGRPPFEFNASASQWDGLEAAGRLEVPLHPGALGLEWVEPSEFRPPRSGG